LFNHRLAKPVRIIGLLGIAMALCACSTVKLAYDSLPRVGGWWLDGYVDLSQAQEERLRSDFAQLQQWHRHEELPKVGALLRQAERMATSDTTPQEVCALVPQIRERILALSSRAEPVAATLALGLSPVQLLHLESKYGKNNAEYRKEWVALPPAEVRDKRMKQYIERMESFYGELDSSQRETIRAQVERSVFDPGKSLQERQRRQQDILLTLRQLAARPDAPGQAPAALHGLVERALHAPDPAAFAYQDALLQEGCTYLAALHQSTTPQQRQSAARRLRAYQRDLRDLVVEP
jgi:hypothetical protein